MGDLPIFVAYESADVWSHQDLFQLDPDGAPTVVAGVPPDYFSETGQRWGNPLYNWDVLAGEGYQWWTRRMGHSMSMFDMIRVDHFRGFHEYWEVPADAETAIDGRWVEGPGEKLFNTLRNELGPLPLVAEDLGMISSDVHRLRETLGLPGMRVLQFGFDEDAEYHRPDNYPRNCVAYTGTHDNDTIVGWFRGRSQSSAERPDPVLEFLGTSGEEIHWDLIRSALASAADLAIIPLQDILGLGSEARMNLPGKADGNWTWRVREEMIQPEMESRLRALTETSGRAGRDDVEE
jgi:4-alpha-glucanotransferase